MGEVTAGSGARSLKTAATVLRALRLLGDHPAGVAPVELAAALGKSAATARYMANTLCLAGYAERTDDGRVRLSDAPPWGAWGRPGPEDTPESAGPASAAPVPATLLTRAVTDLYRLARQRTYLVRRCGPVLASVCETRGHQGLARVPGLGGHVPPQRAHSLGLTRMLLAASPSYRAAVESEQSAGPTPPTTVAALRREVERAGRRGWAADDGEFARGFATVAAPVVSPSGTSTVAIGLSCSSRRLATDQDALVRAVVSVAASTQAAWAASDHSDPAAGLSDRRR